MKKNDRKSMSATENIMTKNAFRFMEAIIDYTIFIADHQGFINTWNAGGTKLFNYTEKEMLGNHFSILYSKKDIAKGVPEHDLSNAAEHLHFENNEACFIKKNGDEFNANLVINKFISDNDEVAYGIIIKDMTVYLGVKKLLKRMEVTLRLFIENTNEYALYLMDPNGNIVTWNRGAERIKGYKANEIIGKHYSTFFTDEDIEKNHPQKILEIAAKNGEYKEEGYRLRKDGSIYWASIALTAIRDKNNKLIGYGKISRDLTDRKTLEELLKKQNQELSIAKKEAEEANNAKSIFLSVMSHEIRTPLNSIIGMTELLMDTELSDEQREDLRVIQSSEKQLLFVINNILDFTKVESGKINSEQIGFNLFDLINDLDKLLTKRAREKGLEIRVNIDKEIPMNLIGDPLRIRQVINNLLDNALKFTERGYIELNVKMALAFNKKHARHGHKKINIYFEIIDTGIGIPEDVKNKLFQPFTQGDPSVARRHGGSGLGLVISKKIVEALGGTLELISTPSVGSKFWFLLPLIEDDSTEKALVKEEKIIFSDEDRKNFRILLAEDNITNRDIAVRLLEKIGYHCDTVIDGLGVLEAIEKKNYDLILMDCQMPEMDGYTASLKIREAEAATGNKHIPIIAMTANTLLGDKKKCLSAGMDNYIPKPFNSESLKNILDFWLNEKLANQYSPLSLINETRLHEILGKDKNLIATFFQTFMKSSHELLEEIQFAIIHKDNKSCREKLHQLKGSCSNSGIYKIPDLCLKIEKLGNDWQAIDLVFKEILLTFVELEKEISYHFTSV